MSGLTPKSSRPGSRRFSRDGFVQLTIGKNKSEKDRPLNDVTVNIPMATVGHPSMGQHDPSAGMNGQQSAFQGQNVNEKSGIIHRHVAGRRVKRRAEASELTGNAGYSSEVDTLTQMGKVYNKVLNFSILTRYMVFIVPLAVLIAIPIIVGATAAKKAELGGVRIVWIFTWVEVVWLSLWVSKIVARLLPAIFQFLCGIVSSGTRKYALVLKSLEIPLSLVGWALASLATFIPVRLPVPVSIIDSS